MCSVGRQENSWENTYSAKNLYFSAYRAPSYISCHVIFTTTLWNTNYVSFTSEDKALIEWLAPRHWVVFQSGQYADSDRDLCLRLLFLLWLAATQDSGSPALVWCFSQDLSYLVPFCPKQPAAVPASVQLVVSLTNCRGGFQQLQSIPPTPLPLEDQGSPCSGDRELDSLMKTLPPKTHNYPFFSCSNFCTISQRKAEIWVTFKPFGHFKIWSGRSTEISGTLLLSAYYLFHFSKLPYDRRSNLLAVNKYLMSTY